MRGIRISGSFALPDDSAARVFDGRRGAESDRRRRSPQRAFAKRTFDILLALALVAAVSILLLAIAIAIKLDSPGPVFHRVRRVGYRGRPLLMLKFRKMHHDAHGKPLTASADPRLTRVGAFLVRTRLDELPQLWDVLRGRMSIVGPRPEDPAFVALHAAAYGQILSVRPGMTGLSQLAFAEEHSILDQDNLVGDYVNRILPQKVGLDVLYAQAHRLRMDVAILAWTVAAMLMRTPVAVHRTTAALSVRRRPRPGSEVRHAEATRRTPAGVG